MPFSPNSTVAGYLGPNSSPAPLEDEAWVDFLHDVVAGVTGLAGELVFPRWQPEPPVHPPVGTDWAAVGISRVEADWRPAIVHVPTGDGLDAMQRMETTELLCTFYGPHCMAYASILRDGLAIDQNLAELRRSAVGVVEVGPFTRAPELFRQRWLDRTDVTVTFRREVRRNYPVLNLLSAVGTVQAQPPGDSRLVEVDWDTSN